MIKKIKMFLLLFLTIVGTFLGIDKVNAQTDKITKGNIVEGPYYITHYRETGPTRWLWDKMNFLVRVSDGAFVYCVQPFVSVNSNATYDVTTEDLYDVAKIEYNDWKIIEKIAYYGYGFQENGYDHTSQKWYAASQMLIWRYANKNVESYFSRTLQGPKDETILADEMAEIMSLVHNHNTLPSFDNIPNEMTIGSTITINDSKNVLSNFTIDNIKGATIVKNENSLSITANEVGSISFDLIKLGNRYGEPTKLYYATDSQNVVRRGNIDPIKKRFDIKVIGGKVTVDKYDDETISKTPQGEGSLSGAIYGIYKEDGTKVGTVITGANSQGTSDYLPSIGRYYLLEEKASEGYLVDPNKYYFDITQDNLYPTIQVFEKVISLDFDIIKVYANDKTGIMTPEVGVVFGIYNDKGEEVRRLKTDSQGNIKFKLPYGTYTVKQLTTTVGFEKAEDFTLEVRETGPVVKKVIANGKITSRLKVVKVDQDGSRITRAGIKFKIKDLNSGKYVCQKVSYPINTTYCEYETDEDGVLITPYPLNSGRYQLEEVDQEIYGYVWNSTPLIFTIDENSDIKETDEFDAILEIHFANQEVKGIIEIFKKGEKLVIEDGKFFYEEIPLPNVLIGLYDESGNLIKILKTDENGFVRFDNLKLGKYTIKEIETENNHVLDGKEYEFILDYKDQYTPIIIKSFTLKNYVKKGGLEFSKTDLTTGKELAGVKLEFYTSNDELIFSGVTDKFGKISIKNLFVGEFYIIETDALDGYKLSDEKVYFKILENGDIVKASMTNEKFKGDLEITKIDISTGEVIPNVLFEIYNAESDELIYSGRTDENGKIIVKGLEYGKYYFIEKEAVGYILNENKMFFEILEDGEIVKSTVSNKKIDMPKTFNTDLTSLLIIGITAVTGLRLLLYAKKNDNK